MNALKQVKREIQEMVYPLKMAALRHWKEGNLSEYWELSNKIDYIYQHREIIPVSKEITRRCRGMEGWHCEAEKAGLPLHQAKVEKNDTSSGEI